jgi:hypothetical protein
MSSNPCFQGFSSPAPEKRQKSSSEDFAEVRGNFLRKAAAGGGLGRKKPPRTAGARGGGDGPGGDRLSRRGHYHGPGGLNGRVRDGNGWGPAGMVAGDAAGGRSGSPVAGSFGGRSTPRGASWQGQDPPRPGPPRIRSPATGRRRGRSGSGRGGQVARLLGPVGCGGRPPCTPGLSTWSSSRSLRCARGAPGNLVLEGASRLDAFSAYPVPTWLPGGAPSGTAGTPAVGPPQSSRTRGDAPQVSSARGR